MPGRMARALAPVDRGRQMRIIATGLLVAMAGLFLIARRYEEVHPAWGFALAFAEAGMVGGIADWFAVTALFRRPLGLPIPHTAIIPVNKNRIADTMAVFLQENFLTPPVIARRIRTMNVASALGAFLADPRGNEQPESRLRAGVANLIGDILESVGAALEENEALLREMIHRKANALLRLTKLDETVANSILDGIYKLLAETVVMPDHPVRRKVEEGLESLAWRLGHDAELQRKIEDLKNEVLANPAFAEWLEGIWERARGALLRVARDPDGALSGQLGHMLAELGDSLQNDERLQLLVNRFARRTLVGTATRYGGQIVRLVSETVRRWDARTVTDRIEGAVGRDLQFIRINGTMVGGLVGVTIHIFEIWL